MTAGTGTVPRPSSGSGSRVPDAPGPRGRATVVALARVEAVRLLRHPAVLAALALYAGFWGYDLATGDAGNRFPVLQDASWSVHLPLLLLAAGVLLAANQGALRAHRNGTEPVYEVLVVDRARRVGAHLLATVPVVLLAALLTAARVGYLAARPGAAGEVRVLDVLAGPGCVLLAGAVGVLLAVLATAPAIAPLALVGLGMLTFAGAVNSSADWRWFGLVAVENENAAPLPASLVDRPAGAHLLWLAALTAVCAVAAVVRAGARGTGWKVAGALALVVALVAGFLQLSGVAPDVAERRTAFTERPAAQQSCTTRSGISYCAFPGFEVWTGEWADVAEGVLRHVPQDAAHGPFAVRQRIFPAGGSSSSGVAPPLKAWAADDAAAGTPGAVTVGTDWSDGAAGGDRRSDAVAGFAVQFAHRVVAGRVPDQPRLEMVCGARSVLVLWLAAEATDGTGDAMRSLRARSWGGISLPLLGSATGLSFEPRGATAAYELIGRPAEQTAAKVAEHWAELTAPGTSVARAAELLGIPAPAEDGDSAAVAGC
ncbi:ABC transporter permease [Kitasatospora sp. NPDC050463]|uniref:ABC transporter permease n=1 Tax=Kitasatospora sp. NPDC050463 TaxID=3155786 RepID=UPI0033DB0A5E